MSSFWSLVDFFQGAVSWGLAVSLALSLASPRIRTLSFGHGSTMAKDTIMNLAGTGGLAVAFAGLMALYLAGGLALLVVLALAIAAETAGSRVRVWVCVYTRARIVTWIYVSASALLLGSVWASSWVGTFGWDEALALAMSGLFASAISGGLLIGIAKAR